MTATPSGSSRTPARTPAAGRLAGFLASPSSGFPLAALIGLLLAATLLVLLAGCQQVGPRSDITRATTTLENGSPVTLQIEDADKKGVASGVGPARYTSITQDEVQTFQTGTTPRDLFLVKQPDGTLRFNLSSGTDIQAEGLEFDAATGGFRVAKFGTSASEPLRAANEAYDRLVAWWKALSADQRAAFESQVRATEAIAPGAIDALFTFLTGL